MRYCYYIKKSKNKQQPVNLMCVVVVNLIKTKIKLNCEISSKAPNACRLSQIMKNTNRYTL